MLLDVLRISREMYNVHIWPPRDCLQKSSDVVFVFVRVHLDGFGDVLKTESLCWRMIWTMGMQYVSSHQPNFFIYCLLTSFKSQEKLDDLCDIFPKPTLPKPRGPEARKSRLSFLDEITSQDLKNGIYSPAQIQTILKQRSNVRKIQHPVSRITCWPSN